MSIENKIRNLLTDKGFEILNEIKNGEAFWSGIKGDRVYFLVAMPFNKNGDFKKYAVTKKDCDPNESPKILMQICKIIEEEL